jgi:hypothetical protein
MKKLILAILLLSATASATYRDYSAPYCRYLYRTHTTWGEYQTWYTHCFWASLPEDAGVDPRNTGGASGTGGTGA